MKKQVFSPLHPIFDAICQKDIDQLKKLIDEGCDLNHIFTEEKQGLTPLMFAAFCCNDYKGIVETLVSFGADVHQKTKILGENALFYSSKRHPKIFDYLALQMHDSFNIDEQNHEGQTVLMRAAEFSNIEMIRCILKYKPQLRLQDKNGKTALQVAKTNDGYDRSEVIEVLEKAFLEDQIERDKALLDESVKTLALPKTINNYKL